jgi:polar amino acid transport system ATP-binding protein
MAKLGDVVVSARGVEKYFGDLHVLRGVDLEVRQHETVMIIGRSGSGKTTFLRCLNFLEEPSAGHIRIGEIDITADPLHSRSSKHDERVRQLRLQAGMVFQDFNLFPHMTVLENCIEAPVRVRKLPRGQAIELAERFLGKVHMLDKRNEYPARLSGGQKQRAAIARALSNEPQVMMFDEPTSALDQELIGDVLNVMEDLAHEGTTMVVVTHEMHFAREAADRIVFMDEGKIIEDGPPSQVLDDPQDVRTQQFLRRFRESTQTQVASPTYMPGWAD